MLTGRQSKLLEILLNNVQGTTGAKLAEYLEVSSRTVRNEIGEINRSWKDGSIIKSSRRKGYFIEEQDMDAVREYFLSEGRGKVEDEMEDRGWTILGMALETGYADVYDLGERLSLSQPAMYKEISRFQKRLLAEYQCDLLKMSGDRLWIEGSEEKIRQTLFRIIRNETQNKASFYVWFLKTFLYGAFDRKEYEWMVKLVKEYFDSRYIQISDSSLYMIASAIYITLVRDYQNHKVVTLTDAEPVKPEIGQFFEYIKEQGLELGDGDRQVLGGLFRGFKMTADLMGENEIDDLSILILEDFCHDVMEKYHFDLRQSSSFYENILIHIEYMMRRMETGYEVKNPILNEIKKQYPYAYEISMMMVPIVYRYKNCYIQDDEISYIAIFVEHFLENVNQKLKAVVISSNRYSINSIVSSWLEMNFRNQIELAETLPKHNLERYLKEHTVDLIISIMDTVVHPEIPAFRVDGIPNHYTQTAMNALVHKIRMNRRFQEIIKEHFNKKTIRIYREKTSFEQVIWELSDALKKEDYIYDVKEFVSDVLQREINYPTVTGDGLMIPHPLVTFAKKTTIGAAVLKKPVRMQEKEIRLIFLLAIERKQNERLGELFQFFRYIAMERSAIGILGAVESEEELVDQLIHISGSADIC